MSPARPPRPARRLVLATVSVLTVAGIAVGLLLRPGPSTLPADHDGDDTLAATVREVLGPDHRALAVATIGPAGTRTVTVGAPASTRFEAGSISKGVTGLLLAQAVQRGEVTETTAVGELLPELAGAPVAEVTLAQLATHRSGLPVQAPTLPQLGRNLWSQFSGSNPYAATEAEQLRAVRQVGLDAEPGTYSNLGFELLGAALARAAGTSYPELVQQRVLDPIGMDTATFPTDPDQLGETDLVGEGANGRRMDPWLGESMAPAGGLRGDVDDLAALAGTLLSEDAPGIEATAPREELDEGTRIGWAWLSTELDDGSTMVWHNGGTGGFASFLGVDRETGTAVVVLSATAGSVDAAGIELLQREGARR